MSAHMDMNQFSHVARNKRSRYSKHEQATILYCLVLLCMLIIAPLIKITQLSASGSETYRLYNSFMSQSAILITIAVWFLIARNSSFRWKQTIYKAFGVAMSQTITTAVVLFMILMQLFAISDTVTLLKQSVSSRFGTTSWFLVLGIYLIAGIIWQLVAARLQRKESQPHQEVQLRSEIDESRKERGFEQMEKEFQGLFDEGKSV